jgi:fucose permease
MSLSQFIKSVAAFFGPLLTVFFARRLGDWRYIFLLYGFLSILSMIWLFLTPISEKKLKENPARFIPCLKLLGNGYVLSMVLGIFIVVGLDVGMNTGVPRFLERYGLTGDQAVKGISIYIFALMTSRFLGALILKTINSRMLLFSSALITVGGLVLLIFKIDPLTTKAAILLVGFGSANVFPLIFSMSVERMPELSNEISGLMIMAISGGAVFPFLMGIIIDQLGLEASIIFLLVISLYLIFLGIKNSLKKQNSSTWHNQ